MLMEKVDQGLTGISAAAPVLFEIFGSHCPKTDWFKMPVNDLKQVNGL
jgi:hypothetical protein